MTQLDDAERCLTSNESLGSTECESLRASFHKIKGGAGFFDLPDVALAGASIESIFKLGPEEASREREKIRIGIAEIRKALESIRPCCKQG